MHCRSDLGIAVVPAAGVVLADKACSGLGAQPDCLAGGHSERTAVAQLHIVV